VSNRVSTNVDASSPSAEPLCPRAPVDLSVVVPVHNEMAILGSTIDSMLAHLRPLTSSFEIILVENGSTDGTRQGTLPCRPARRSTRTGLCQLRQCRARPRPVVPGTHQRRLGLRSTLQPELTQEPAQRGHQRLPTLSEICPSPHPKPVQTAPSRETANADFIGAFCTWLAYVKPFHASEHTPSSQKS
jgi:hypothetical protein